MDILNTSFYGISAQTWLIALGITLASFLIIQLLKTIFLKQVAKLVERTRTDIDDLFARLLEQTKFFFVLGLAIYIGSLTLELGERDVDIIRTVLIGVTLLQVGFWGNGVIGYVIQRKVKRELELEQDPADATTFEAFGVVLKIALWVIVALLILENSGVEVNSLVASLGISGIAVALAVQNILGDLFSSLSIALDKPFVIGDFIIVGDYAGTVEHIGLKSTRVHSLSGEQLVFSNSDLLNSRIRNYKRMTRRRVVFTIGITYQTDYNQLSTIPNMIQDIIEKQDKATFDRCHFNEFGDSSLNFETVYYVETPEYSTYMDIQQSINLSLLDSFQKEGIEFAYPTRTLFVENNLN